MEENSRLPEAPPDLAAAEGGCRNELTRTNSGSSSVTVDNSKDLSRRTTNARPPFMAWTNEKHNSYLASLEASFVKQLHHSLCSLSRRSEQNTCDPSPSMQLPVDASYSSDQFSVLQDGFWQKINFERNQSLPSSAAGSHGVKESSWIRHIRCSGKHSTKTSAVLRECSALCSKGMVSRGRIFSHRLLSLEQKCVCHKCHQNTVDNIAEVSDQNFEDEDQEKMSSGLSKAKRLKNAEADASTKDQIVPCGNLFSEDVSTASDNLSEREEQMHHERLSEFR